MDKLLIILMSPIIVLIGYLIVEEIKYRTCPRCKQNDWYQTYWGKRCKHCNFEIEDKSVWD